MKRASFAALLAVFLQTAWGQQNPVIQTETRVVLVDAIVTGKNGAYINDLKREDFHVFQDNKEQTLQSFSLETASKAAEPRSLLLFFDKTSMEARDQVLAREAAARFIDAETGPNRRMAVVVIYDGGLRIAQTFTDNAGRLKDALPSVESNLSPEEKSGDGPRASVPVNSAAADLGARNMIRALRDLGQSLGVLPGRKIVILFSGGQKPSSEQRSALRDAIEVSNRSRVAFYPVDVRSVTTQTELGPPPAPLPADRHPRGGRGGAQPQGDNEDVGALSNSGVASQQMILELANGTGGFVIKNSNDLLGGLRSIAAEQDEYYALTFSPPEAKEGACHTLRVKVDRPGMTVRSRTSYCTSKPLDLLAGTSAGKSLEQRAAAPQAGNLAASLELAYFYVSANLARVHATMEIPASGLKFQKAKGRLHAEIDLLGIATAPDGSVQARFSDAIRLDLDTPEQVEALKQRGVHYEKEFKIVPGQYRFTVALGQGEATFGKVQAPLVVDPWMGKFALSSLALSRETRPAAGLGLTLMAEDRTPLVAENIQVVPYGSNRFRRSEPAFFYFEIYGADASAARIRVRILDGKTGEAKWDSGMRKLPVPADSGKPTMVPAGSSLPLAGLAPGPYRLEVTATGPDGMTHQRITDFEIE
jgi:VWFA-related protein